MKHRTVTVPFPEGASEHSLIVSALEKAGRPWADLRAHEVLSSNRKSARIVVWFD